MHYCYHCSEPITKDVKICPHCKRSLDMSMYESLLSEQETSGINKSTVRRVWLQEHKHLIWPFITLFLGIIIGGVVFYTLAQLSFSGVKSELEQEIVSLNGQIEEQQNAASAAQAGLDEQLAAKDNIISILDEQKEQLTRIINFTRRFAQNSLITPNSDEVANSFKRNFIYLNNLFYDQQEELEQTEHQNIKNYNLQTIPQVLSD